MAVGKIKGNWNFIGSTAGNGSLTYPSNASELYVVCECPYDTNVDVIIPFHILISSIDKKAPEFYGGARFENAYGVGASLKLNISTRNISCRGFFYNSVMPLADVTIKAYYK